MPIEELTPEAAKKILDENAEAIYLDVRSIQEFEAEHPEGAINIPILHQDPSGSMVPNPDFEAVVEANLSTEKVLVVGCLRGGRSMKACLVLETLGFDNLYNVIGGFGGVMDPRTGQVSQAGWKDCNLPTSCEPAPGARYEELKDKV